MPFWRRVGGGGVNRPPTHLLCGFCCNTISNCVVWFFKALLNDTHRHTHLDRYHGSWQAAAALLPLPFRCVALPFHSFMWLQCVWKTSAAVPVSVRSAANHLRVVHQWFNIKWADRAIAQDRGLGGFLISLGSASQSLFCFIFDSFLSRKRGR